jgi:predicted amidophosphoribosyltransferase
LPGYMHPCRHCGKLSPPDANVCPSCGKVNPLQARCPKCANPIRKSWVACSSCGLSLRLACPFCGRDTFFSDYCEHCDARLVVKCQNRKCGAEQPPLGGSCSQCGKPL